MPATQKYFSKMENQILVMVGIQGGTWNDEPAGFRLLSFSIVWVADYDIETATSLSLSPFTQKSRRCHHFEVYGSDLGLKTQEYI